jgi:hypothetical protein
MWYSYHNQLITEHGWVKKSSSEFQDFSDTNAVLWPTMSEFYKNPRGPLFPIQVV